MIISLDTECTGLDLAHGAMPFLVTTCDDEGHILFWEWDVDPITRRVIPPQEDLVEITELIEAADLIYLHNAKFDVRALATIDIDLPWSKVRDSLVGSHLLGSNHSHKLKDSSGFGLCERYLGVDISKHEVAMGEVVKTCRTLAKRTRPDWKLADEGVPGMPSVKAGSKRDEDKPWKNDMWLPRALVVANGGGSMSWSEVDVKIGQGWQDSTSRYANADSEHTLPLGVEIERLIREQELWKIYEHRLHLPRVACEMESYGITVRGEYVDATVAAYEEYIAEAEYTLKEVAAKYGHKLELAEGASINDNMRDFFYGAVHQSCVKCGYTKRIKHWNGERAVPTNCPKCAKTTRRQVGIALALVTTEYKNLALPLVRNGKSKGPSLDKDAMDVYLATLEGDAHDFMEILLEKRKHDTALTTMQQYRRYWVPVEGHPGWYRIHCSLNPCGTDHLRWASNSPNMQNTSTKEVTNTRSCFGPLPGREFWSMDYESIEARIPAFESGEDKLIQVFEKPDEPPYWGNGYYVTASLLYPDEFWPRSKEKVRFKDECPRLYKQAKFFVLAKQYGAGRKKGDALSKIRDSYDLVDGEMPKLAALQTHYLRQAEKLGYVQTLPDRSVDPDRGYPILASRTDDGRVLTTTPFNYHVSGTACWCKNTALVRCSAQCAKWRAEGFDARMSVEVHDEILFDFPRGEDKWANLDKALVLKGLMEQSGEDLIPRIPTPVSVKLHVENWAKGEPIPSAQISP